MIHFKKEEYQGTEMLKMVKAKQGLPGDHWYK